MSCIVLEADELLNEAIMSGTGIIIVEGIDDVPFYEKLFSDTTNEIEVYAAENVLFDKDGVTTSCGEGCDGVLRCLELADIDSESIDIEKYLLGIIDKDVREYRGQTINNPAILTLKHYSFESHFVNKETAKYLINISTRATDKLLQHHELDNIYNRVMDSVSNLYYISLEALKNSCVTAYSGSIGYSDSIESIKNRGANTFSTQKIGELDLFAHQVSD